MGPCQPKLSKYPPIAYSNQNRHFQYGWFAQFPWLEYSKAKNSAFCFPCYLFDKCSSKYVTFTREGFQDWKRVKERKKCPFAQHEGNANSLHSFAMEKWNNLVDSSHRIDKVINKVTSQEILSNRLRLKTSIESMKWLVMQGCAFRGHDESIHSTNRRNFIELVKLQARVNEEIVSVVLENAPQNAKYTSSKIQKELLHIFSNKVQNMIREEVGDAKFCILVDETLDESNKEQMAIILRYVDCKGIVRERYFEVVNVIDTNALMLKKEICNVLSRYNLLVESLRGQGYDGASNMRGEWNGLKALFRKYCLYAYYMHCFAHRLQLALVAVSKEVHEVCLALNPIDGFKSFNIEDIYTLAQIFYPQDFTRIELDALRRQLEHYEYAVVRHADFQNIASLSQLCQGLVETRTSDHFFLVGRLILLVLTLSVSTATTERAFSAMNLVKTSLRNKMDNDFLANCLVVYIEREFTNSIDVESIINEFDEKSHRVKHSINELN
ncbi:zinc finger MYM-type protein 1-like [Zingiber officinale]|uniref:zinc finger MYM-type protein 1-like n=1 Tax=Zingiber officinale TaxID=94328 RepID=UPI001C4D8740|nr:zinc finger MYM-type protein 1-like [Zingiber officinale]